ncbi:MAG: hypothetical protein A2900_05010 [Candidatus Chisholmbacteria bacterium RIFCSPLOWO2_01_FULL_50_28]|uniref:Sortase n=1 Tax=Candidatus Chisholmbacteria bacterium RIFCSPHIGHO2_01_FULL_52_32 TaxID=1797591 RepID=A0A1G1VS34_9BACT|nr:MAG: hypothetical protein A2786_01730 [Candidatus Chisholmbacteria bacterium RIFCSPHIGHO2_01_FULL_52_32]OGY20408.1 MAG: hypothetical protein A2900_05010 [Candidatus Chisholmbacteria bacterium RIFCSPLOWO2_01_FULL_50_28]
MRRIVRFLAVLSVLGGAFLLALPYFWSSHRSESERSLEKDQAVIAKSRVEREPDELPLRVRVNKVSVDLPVKSATVSENDWGLYVDAVSYLKTSGKPGKKGNLVLYGHNTNRLLGPLRWAGVGDRVFLETESRLLSYRIVEKKIVPPTQLDIVFPTNDERLTLFTCTNFNDADRLVLVAQRSATFGDLLSSDILSE